MSSLALKVFKWRLGGLLQWGGVWVRWFRTAFEPSNAMTETLGSRFTYPPDVG